LFATGANALGVRWPERRAVSSVIAVTRSVRAGRGLGLSVRFGPLVREAGVRLLPLDNFPPLALVLFWSGPATAEIKTLVALARTEAARVLKRAGAAAR
jgi:hypothetical protein